MDIYRKINKLSNILEKSIYKYAQEETDNEFWQRMFSNSSPEEVEEKIKELIPFLRDTADKVSFKNFNKDINDSIMVLVDNILQWMVPSKRENWRVYFKESIEDIAFMLKESPIDKDLALEINTYMQKKRSEFRSSLSRAIIEIVTDLNKSRPKTRKEIEADIEKENLQRIDNAKRMVALEKQKQQEEQQKQDRERERARERAKLFKR